MRRVLIVVGAVSPPVTGKSVVTEAMVTAIDAAAATDPALSVTRITISVDRPRAINVLRKAGMLLSAIAAAARARFSGAIVDAYVAADAGYGAYLSGATARLLQPFCRRLFIHHHGYVWLARQGPGLGRLLFFRGATHVTQCDAMSAALAARYGDPPTFALSNAFLVAPVPADAPERTRTPGAPMVLGHLSNLTLEKGLGRALDAYAALRSAGVPVRLRIAGDPADATARRRLDAARAEDPTIDHLGFLSGEAKVAFYRSLDAFLFPSLYPVETEAIVTLEAMAAGAPVIAFDQCCIGGNLAGSGGLAAPTDADYAAEAATLAAAWAHAPEQLAAASMAARRRFEALRRDALERLDRLVAALTAP